MKLPVRNIEGREVRTLEVDDAVFGIQPNEGVVHQAFVIQRNNQRWGTANTKTRGEVQGSTRKVRPQKGTGNARQGSNRAPHRVGGGVVFGPRQRDYSQKMPKKMRRLAIRSALSGKAAGGELVVIDQLSLQKPKTKEIMRILHNVGMERSALLVTAQSDRAVLASARNLPKTKVLPAAHLNIVDMMNHAGLLMTEQAVRVAEQLWGRPAVPPKPAPVVEKRPAARTRRAAKAAAVEPEAVTAKAAKSAVEPAATVKALARKRTTAATAAKPPAKALARKRTTVATAAKPPAKALAGKRTTVATAAKPPAKALAGKRTTVATAVKPPAKALAGKRTTVATAAKPPAKPRPVKAAVARAKPARAPAAAAAEKPKRARRTAAGKPAAKAAAAAPAAEAPKPRRPAKKPAEGEG